MSDIDKLLYEAQRRGVLEPLKMLIEGTEQLTDWKPRVGKNSQSISYDYPLPKRMMVRYDLAMVSDLRLLDANVNMRNNQFGSVFGVGKDDVYERLRSYLPRAVKGILTRGEDFVPIEDNADAEQFLEFLRSFVEQAEE